jgi:hypothetical protein
MKCIRVASASGFWGDWQEAPIRQVRGGEIDYLVLDYLAELTMSVLAKQKEKNPQAGFALDFVQVIQEILPDICAKNIKVVANAGGVNVEACAQAIQAVIASAGFSEKISVATVSGDNIHAHIPELQKQGESFSHFDSGKDFASIKGKIISANAYLGSVPIVQALQTGAQIIVTGRVSDASLALAPMIHEFAWNMDDWDKLALGTVAGHLIECGAQASGGNCSFDWQSIPDLANIGYPIIEIQESGECVITKHEGTGGRISVPILCEQLVYEIGDPKQYFTPDVVADFTSVKLEEVAENRVKISGVQGAPAPSSYKVSACYANGYKGENTLIYSGPDAVQKAECAREIFLKRVEKLQGLEKRVELIGVNACHGERAESSKPSEVMLRVAARGADKAEVKKFIRELVPLVLSGPPSASGYTSGGQVTEVYSYWPTLVRKSLVDRRVEVKKYN